MKENIIETLTRERNPILKEWEAGVAESWKSRQCSDTLSPHPGHDRSPPSGQFSHTSDTQQLRNVIESIYKDLLQSLLGESVPGREALRDHPVGSMPDGYRLNLVHLMDVFQVGIKIMAHRLLKSQAEEDDVLAFEFIQHTLHSLSLKYADHFCGACIHQLKTVLSEISQLHSRKIQSAREASAT